MSRSSSGPGPRPFTAVTGVRTPYGIPIFSFANLALLIALSGVRIGALQRRMITSKFEDCGNSSVGRAQPCQGWGRRFEPGFPLQLLFYDNNLAEWQSGNAADCKSVNAGSIPTSASISICRGGEIGRHTRLKILRPNSRAGSIPARGTIFLRAFCVLSIATQIA